MQLYLDWHCLCGGSLGGPLDDLVHGAAGDFEEFCDFRSGVLPSLIEGDELGFPAFGEFGLLATEPAFGLGDLHAFAHAGADQVGFEFGDHGQDVKEEPADRVRRVMHGSADAQFHLLLRQLFDDVACIGNGPGESVQFGDDQGVADADRGNGFAQSGARVVRSGQSMVGVNAIFGYAEGSESIALCGQALLIGGNARVPDECAVTRPSVALMLPKRDSFAGGVYANR